MKEVARSKGWGFILYEHEDKYILSALCGTVGLFETNIILNDAEVEAYKKCGTEFIEKLASQITDAPDSYHDRHIRLPKRNGKE